MIRPFLTFLTGFFFVLVAVPTLIVVSLDSFLFEGSFLKGGFFDASYEIGVESLVDEVRLESLQVYKIVGREQLMVELRKNFDPEFVRDFAVATIKGVEEMGDRLMIDLVPLRERAKSLAHDLAGDYVDGLENCGRGESIGSDLALPKCLDSRLGNTDFLKEGIKAQVMSEVESAIPANYVLQKQYFPFAGVVFSGVRTAVKYLLFLFSFVLLALNVMTLWPDRKNYLKSIGLLLVLVGFVVFSFSILIEGFVAERVMNIEAASNLITLFVNEFAIFIRNWVLILWAVSLIFLTAALISTPLSLKK